jgi:hypothetical protein
MTKTGKVYFLIGLVPGCLEVEAEVGKLKRRKMNLGQKIKEIEMKMILNLLLKMVVAGIACELFLKQESLVFVKFLNLRENILYQTKVAISVDAKVKNLNFFKIYNLKIQLNYYD